MGRDLEQPTCSRQGHPQPDQGEVNQQSKIFIKQILREAPSRSSAELSGGLCCWLTDPIGRSQCTTEPLVTFLGLLSPHHNMKSLGCLGTKRCMWIGLRAQCQPLVQNHCEHLLPSIIRAGDQQSCSTAGSRELEERHGILQIGLHKGDGCLVFCDGCNVLQDPPAEVPRSICSHQVSPVCHTQPELQLHSAALAMLSLLQISWKELPQEL